MILTIVCFAWCNDIFAYLVGMCIGKHKLNPQISPKKTVEGSLGGIVFSMIATVVALIIYQNIFDCNINYPLAVFYAFCCSVIGQIGDLSFSYIKRSYGIKDFGRLLPGHGGVLDRLDSLIFICPFFYMLITLQNFIV
jgi:phosphatidate cytidylyltransferase